MTNGIFKTPVNPFSSTLTKGVCAGLLALCCQLALVSVAEQPFDPLTEKPNIDYSHSVAATTASDTAETKTSSVKSDTTTSSTGTKHRHREVPVGLEVATFPFRFVTGSLGLAYGAFTGGLKGMGTQPKTFSDATFGKADEKPWMVPVGLVGLPISVPYGFLQGFPPAAVEKAHDWYHVWD